MKLIYYAIILLFFTATSFAAVKPDHPRLYLTEARIATMQAAAKENTPQWQRLMTFVDGNFYSLDNQHIMNRALVYKIKKANGDADANTYRDAAITRTMALIEYGTITGVTANGFSDATKDWIDEESIWSWDLLNIKKYFGVNPDITQEKTFRLNVGYQADATYKGYCVGSVCSGHTDTDFFVHPTPNASLATVMFSDRSEFISAANVGATYVLFPTNPDFTKDRVHGMALAFDWLYDDLTTQQKDLLVAWMWSVAEFMMTERDYGTESYSWGNYPLNYLSDLTAIAYAIYGYDTPKANTILAYVDGVYASKVKNSLLWTMQGGGWLEGDGYGAAILHRFTEFLDHGYTAEGLDRWADFSDVLKDRLLYSMHMTLPTVKTGTGGVPYREIIANGDGARAWEAAYDYLRKSCLMILDHYPSETMSKTAQTFFSDTTDRNIYPFSSGWEFMFFNPTQATLPVSNAPLQNAAINTGMIQMRSDWGGNATQATFKCGPKLAYHSHLDATAFTIFKGVDLAPDTGTYPGSGGSTHGVNYFARTIAHNALTLYDSAEASWPGTFQGGGPAVSNDGGQRNLRTFNPDGSIAKTGSWQTSGYSVGTYKYLGNEDMYKMGSITKYDSGNDFVYSVGDATSGYDGNTHKASQVLRKFLYLRPDLFVVYDKIKTKDTTITPKFVLHSVDSLIVNGTGTEIAANAEYHYTDGNTLTLDNGVGRLFCKTLLPVSPVIKKIGGRNLRDFWVDGVNYPGGSPVYGLWRAEVETPTQATYTEFLTSLYATTTSTSSMPSSSVVISSGGNMKGVVVGDFTVLFSAAQNDVMISSSAYTTTNESKHIITDLVPGTYAVTKDGVDLGNFTTSAVGTLVIDTVSAGAFTLLLAGELPPSCDITHLNLCTTPELCATVTPMAYWYDNACHSEPEPVAPPESAGITIGTGGSISITPAVTGGASIGVVQ